jgi:Peptidase family M28
MVKSVIIMKRTPIILLFIWSGFLALACNLSSPPPPTLVPRLTDTPQPTIAIATSAPPEQPSSSAVNVPSASSDVRSLLAQLDSDRLMIHVDALERMVTRHVNSPDTGSTGVAAAYRYVRGQFEDIASQSAGRFSVIDHSFTLEWEGVATIQKNILGYLPGDAIGGGVIVIGAHYDSITRDPADALYNAPGANDNGSGVAALIEIGRILARRPHRASIMLVAFAAEEVGRAGSVAFVNFLREKNITVDAMLSLDIIGSQTGPNGEIDTNHLRVFSAGPEDSPSRQLARSIYWIGFNLSPDMQILVQDAEDREGRYSDHMSFSAAGFPAVRFIESLEDRLRQHTPQDVIGDVQASYLLRSTQCILAAVTVLADGLPPPRNNIILRDNGTPKRTLVWETVPGATGYLIGLRAPGSNSINQQFPWPTNSVDWEGFVPSQLAGVVISSIDDKGMMGPPSTEYAIR